MNTDWMENALLDARDSFLKLYKRYLIGYYRHNMSSKNRTALERIMARRRHKMSLYLKWMVAESYLKFEFWNVLEYEMRCMLKEYRG